MKFDFIQAFAVFTDVPMDHVDECFANLGRVLAPGGLFVATYVPGERYAEDRAQVGFQYPWKALQEIASRHGYIVRPVPDFPHPRGHRLFLAKASDDAGVPALSNEASRRWS